MTSFQRMIKYLGMALALLITVTIIGGICAAIYGFTSYRNKKVISDVKVVSDIIEFGEFSSMDIDSGISNVIIETGDNYAIETVNVPDTLDVEIKGETLTISNREEFVNWFTDKDWTQESKIRITVPTGYSGNKIHLQIGTGNVSISDVSVDKFIVDGGVGDLTGSNLVIADVQVDAGVGDVEFEDVDFGKVDINSGVGNIIIEGTIRDDSDFDGGVGNIDLTLLGSRDDYSINVDSGIGGVYIDGDEIESFDESDHDKPILELNGGVGSISVDFLEN